MKFIHGEVILNKVCHSCESRNPERHWIPGQARNDNNEKTYVVVYRIVILLLILIFLLPVFSFSQPRPWRKEARCWGASELNLSSEQAKSLDLLQQAYLKETQLLRAQLVTKRLEFREFLTNPGMRMESIRAKYLEVAETQSKMEEKAIEYLVKVRSLLTQEQLKSWCPEEELPLFQRMMPGHRPMGPRSPRRPLPPEE